MGDKDGIYPIRGIEDAIQVVVIDTSTLHAHEDTAAGIISSEGIRLVVVDKHEGGRIHIVAQGKPKRFEVLRIVVHDAVAPYGEDGDTVPHAIAHFLSGSGHAVSTKGTSHTNLQVRLAAHGVRLASAEDYGQEQETIIENVLHLSMHSRPTHAACRRWCDRR